MCYTGYMKRFIAIIFVFTILLVCAAPAINASETESSGSTVFNKNSNGAMVVRIQQRLRELGYLNFKPTGAYKSMTERAVKDFQTNYRDKGQRIQTDGILKADQVEWLFRPDALRVTLSGISIPSGPKHGSGNLKKTGSIVAWSEVKQMLNQGAKYLVTDCYTGNTFELFFTGGENHAEMEPASVDDFNEYKGICGSEFNYLKRPVVVKIDDKQIAASIQCWPHGEGSIDSNGMDGHVCLFFDGSYSHVGMLPDVEHTENVYKAGGQ